MKKRLFAGLIASAMMASMLAGCGGSSGSNGNAQGGDKASGDGYSMTLIMSLRDEFLSKLAQSRRLMSLALRSLRRTHRTIPARCSSLSNLLKMQAMTQC